LIYAPIEEENPGKPKYAQTTYTFKNAPCRSNNITITGKKCTTKRIGGSTREELIAASSDFE
jgi:hypothetical protein